MTTTPTKQWRKEQLVRRLAGMPTHPDYDKYEKERKERKVAGLKKAVHSGYDSPRTAEIVALIEKATVKKMTLNKYLPSIGKPRNLVANYLLTLDEKLKLGKITKDDHLDIKVAYMMYQKKLHPVL